MDFHPFQNPLKDFLSVSLDRCMDAVGARSGSIFLVDDDTKELVLEIVQNNKRLALEGTRTRLGEGIAGRVALERRPFLVRDVESEDFSFPSRYDHYRSKSFLSVPLESADGLMGVVNLTEKTEGETFDERDLKTITTISKYLGIALQSLKTHMRIHAQQSRDLERKQQSLKKSVEQYKKFSSMGKFVGGLVHEINNPLDGVIRYLNLCLDVVDDDTVVREYLLEAKEGLNRIAQFVKSLLDFTWSLSAPGRDIDVCRSIEEALFQFEHQCKESRIEVEKSFQIPSIRIPDYGIRIVLNNVIKNACEAMKETGGRLRVESSVREKTLCVTVSDTGPGIPQGVIEKMFDPFFTTKNMGEGSGLGLAICQEVVQKYKGRIFAESTLQEGTSINVFIPLNGTSTDAAQQ